jgi:hypothetical protein
MDKTCMRHNGVQSYLLSSRTVFKTLAPNFDRVIDHRVMFFGFTQDLQASSR